MKSKYLAFGLSAVLVLSLASCGGQQEQPPQEPTPEIQQVEPIKTEPVITPEEIKQEIVPTASTEAPEENQGIIEVDGTEEAGESTPEVQLFTDCNETVYATGTVNIRASYTADSNKLGSLTRGQSITRTGVGVNDADGWSRVQLADGSTAYISNKYLSVTKPSTQQSGGQQQSGQQQQSKPSGSTQQQQQAQTSEGQQSDATLDDLAKALQGLQDEGYVGSDRGRDLTDEEIAALVGSLELAP